MKFVTWRRIISLISMMCLFSILCFAVAEVEFNVEDYSDDELIEIMKAIYEADTQLGYLYSNDVLEVGTDIPAGAYEFWVEESDIGFSQKMIDEPLDYQCGSTTLCYIQWADEYDQWNFENYVAIYYDQYNDHVKINLEEGQFVWTGMGSGGANYVGLRMKYFPNRKSGLFAE